jgi:ketosteroid isomerase-like protein
MRKIFLGICFLAIAALPGAAALYAQNLSAELKKLDEQRMKSISDADIAAVGELIADDYVHVHANGQVMNKSEYLEFLEKNPRKSWRAPDANVITHVYGDIALMVGPQINKTEKGEPTAFTLTLVWRKIGGSWKQVGAAYTPIPTPKK